MLRKILPAMTDDEFMQVLDLATVDVLVNRVGYKQRTGIDYVCQVAEISLELLRR